MKKLLSSIFTIFALFLLVGTSKTFASGTVFYSYPNTVSFSNVGGCGTGNNYDIVISDTDYPNQGNGTVYVYDYGHAPAYFPHDTSLSGLGMTTGNTYYAMLLCDDTGFIQAGISFVYNVSNQITYSSATHTVNFGTVTGCGTGNNYDIVISDTDYPNQGNGVVYVYDYGHAATYFPKSVNVSGLGMTTGYTYYAMLLCDDTGFVKNHISFNY